MHPAPTEPDSPPDQWGQTSKKTGLLMAVVLSTLTLAFLLSTLLLQRRTQEASTQFNALVDAGEAAPLREFTAEFLSCNGIGDAKVCVPIGESVALRFPDVAAIATTIRGLPREPTHAVLRHRLTQGEAAWLNQKNTASLVLVRNVHVATRLLGGPKNTVRSVGNGATTTFSIDSNSLFQRDEELTLEIEMAGLPYFGPGEFPIALVSEEATADYQALALKQQASAGTGRQLQLAIPFVLAVLAVFLDHTAVFRFLAVLGALRASRAFLSVLVEGRVGAVFIAEHPLATSGFMGLLNGLVVVAFLVLAMQMARTPASIWRRARLGLPLLPAGFVLHGVLAETSWLTGDILADFLGAGGAAIVLVAAFFRRAKARTEAPSQEQKESSVGEMRKQRIEHVADLASLALGAAVLGLLAYANGAEIISASESKSIIDWKYAIFYPGMILIAFSRVGSSSRVIAAVATDLARKRLLEQEISAAVRLMRGMQGERKGNTGTLAWRAMQRQAVSVGGDFFDVRELTFAGEERIVVVILADVTGHGVHASMVTNTIGSAWGSWCNDVTKERRTEAGVAPGLRPRPLTADEKQAFLNHAPARIHALLSAARVPGSCTAIFALFDPFTHEVTLCNASHPHPILVGESGYTTLVCKGRGARIGGFEPDPVWPSMTTRVTEGTVYLYSDGIFPDDLGVSPPSFLKSPRIRSEDKRGVFDKDILWRRFRAVQRLYVEKRPPDEDDITVLGVRFTARAEP